MNEETKYKDRLLKRYLIEPHYENAMFLCLTRCGEFISESGVKVKGVRGGSLFIDYTRPNGDRLTAIVHNKEQYTKVYYQISQVSYKDHPEARPVAKVIKPKRDFMTQDKSLLTEAELGAIR